MSSDMIQTADGTMAATYLRHPILLTRGEGCRLWDDQDNCYTDFLAGIAVCNLGHAHPRVAEALYRQARTLCHVSNLYYTEPQIRLARWLTERSFADRVFFCNSGAEANEAAIKLARRYFHQKGQSGRNRIISARLSFHGRTMATLSATGQEKIKTGFAPLLEGFDFIPFNDIDALKHAVTPETCAVLLEPIQGEGGVRVPAPGYLRQVRDLCDREGILLIFDEIQTGIGRTGKLFAHEHFDAVPDIMTLAKALGNGLPIGAMLARDPVMAAFSAGAHATTFGGTPVITAAALAVLETIEEEGLVAHCAEMGDHFIERLTDLASRHACIQSIRGMGLLVGVELDRPGGPVVDACRKAGYLINCIQDCVLRFAPPLIIQKADIDGLIAVLDRVLAD